MEGRLAGLEKAKAKALSEIRLQTEIDRAHEDAAKAFPLSDRLSEAQRRAADIEQQLHEAAKTPTRGNPPAGEAAGSNQRPKTAASRVSGPAKRNRPKSPCVISLTALPLLSSAR